MWDVLVVGAGPAGSAAAPLEVPSASLAFSWPTARPMLSPLRGP